MPRLTDKTEIMKQFNKELHAVTRANGELIFQTNRFDQIANQEAQLRKLIAAAQAALNTCMEAQLVD